MGTVGGTFTLTVAIITVAVTVYIIMAGITGLIRSAKVPCSSGQCIISADGQNRICAASGSNVKTLMTPNDDYPICVDALNCPSGFPYAFHADGSALTNTCETPGCSCSIFQHCPAYVNVVFRMFGSDERVSFYQVIDSNVSDDKIQDPYDPPYAINVGRQDERCFVTVSNIDMISDKLVLGDQCAGGRGTFAQLSTNTELAACVPTNFVKPGTTIFDVEKYMTNYRIGN